MNESIPHNENTEIFSLSPWDFDQSRDGWRKIQNEPLKAARLIQKYISLNKEIILNPREGEQRIGIQIMYFHIGQLLATSGKEHFDEALLAFKESFQENKECWNAYVSATMAFLEGNTQQVEDAIKIVQESKEIDKSGGNLGIIKNFKKCLESGKNDYMEAYLLPRE